MSIKAQLTNLSRLAGRLRRLFVFTVIALSCCTCAAQNTEEIQKLLTQLAQEKTDTGRANILNELAFAHIDSDHAVARKYALEALAASGGNDETSGRKVGNRHFPKGEATALNVLGVILDSEGKYREAIVQFTKAAEIRLKLGDYLGAGGVYNNLAGAYESLNHRDSSYAYAKRALFMAEMAKNPGRIARAQYGLASRLEQQGDYTEAQKYAQLALVHYEDTADTTGQIRCLTLLGGIMMEAAIYQNAVAMYGRAVRLSATQGDEIRYSTCLRNYANALSEVDSVVLAHQHYEKAKALQIHPDYADELALTQYNQAELYKKEQKFSEALALLNLAEPAIKKSGNQRNIMLLLETKSDILYDMGKLDEAEALINEYHKVALSIQDSKFILKSYKDRSKIALKRGRPEEAYRLRKVYADSLEAFYIRENAIKFARSSALLEDLRKQAEIEKQQIQLAETERQMAQDKLVRNSLLGGAAFLALVTLFLWYLSISRKRANTALAAKNAEIESERQRADALLANILPQATAQELKANQSVKPVRYESVSVLFTDFSGFTETASTLAPETVVFELDRCFRMLDEIVEQHGLEKIKTIGDAYMCACGLPEPKSDHAERTVRAALMMQKVITEHMKQNEQAGRPVFRMRLGIHSGPVVAGVVGSRKFAYDIWGNTVNVAARMEAAGEVGRVNISQATWILVKDQFVCTARGAISVKSLGETEMYFVERER